MVSIRTATIDGLPPLMQVCNLFCLYQMKYYLYHILHCEKLNGGISSSKQMSSIQHSSQKLVGTCINTQGSYYCSPTHQRTSNLKRWIIGLSGAVALLLLCLILVVVRSRRNVGGRTLVEQDRTSLTYSLK